MAGNQFKARKFEDHEIVDDTGAKVGDIRVKPSGILWASKGAHKWYGVNMKTFSDFMEQNGKEQKK